MRRKTPTLSLVALLALLTAPPQAQAWRAIPLSLQNAAGSSLAIFIAQVVQVTPATKQGSARVKVEVQEILKTPPDGKIGATEFVGSRFGVDDEQDFSELAPGTVFFLFATEKLADAWSGTMVVVDPTGKIVAPFYLRGLTDITTRDALAKEIRSYLSPDYLAEQIKLASDPNNPRRIDAVEILGDLRNPAAWNTLESIALEPRDPGGALLERALRGLFYIDEKRVGAVALKLLEKSANAWQARYAPEFLGENKDPRAVELCLAAIRKFEPEKDYGPDAADNLLNAITALRPKSAEVEALVLRMLKDNPIGRKHVPITAAAHLNVRAALPLLCPIIQGINATAEEARTAGYYLGVMLGAARNNNAQPLDSQTARDIAARDLPALKPQLPLAREIDTAVQTKILILPGPPVRYVYVGWFQQPGDPPLALRAVLAYETP